jgi:uncharacterized cupin superfamily protein
MNLFNLLADQWEEHRTRPGYAWRRRGVGRSLGAQLIGASLYELPPGQATWPYHWHWANEELLLVVTGKPTLRTPAGQRQLDAGDAVAFPRGPAGAHHIRNGTEAPTRVLIISTMMHPGIGEYPDSGKLIVTGGASPIPGTEAPLELVFPRDSGVAYWDDGDPASIS